MGTVADPKVQEQFDAMEDSQGRKYSNSSERFRKRPLDGSRPLWYRQPKESISAYEAFMTYLTMPREERSVARTGETVGKSYSCMSK